MDRRELLQRLIAVLGAMNVQRARAAGADPAVASAYQVRSSHLSLGLSRNGEIDSVVLLPEPGKRVARQVTGRTVLVGCQGRSAKARKLAGGGIEFTKHLAQEQGPGACQLRERFTPTKSGSVRWEMEILGEGEPWSVPLETHLAWPATPEASFWTTCGNTQLEISSKIFPAHGEWHDPLTPAPFLARTLVYGGKDPVQGADAFSVPIASVLETKEDVGFSLALSPAEFVPEMVLTTTPQGGIAFSRLHVRISKEKAVRFTADLVAHPADWRGGLGWYTAQYPEYFDPPNPRTYQIAGLGAYSEYEGELDNYKYLSMNFRVNWKAGYDMYYMGMFLPPVDDDVQWICNRATTGTPEYPTSIARLRAYSERMRQGGFHVLNYFNICEFGEHVEEVSVPRQVKAGGDKNLWQDPSKFVFAVFGEAVMRDRNGKLLHGWEHDVQIDPAEPVFQQFALEQVRRHIERLPASSGLNFDEMQYLRSYNFQRDDGISWIDGRPARSLVVSWHDLMSKISAVMVAANKVIYANPLYRRLDVVRYLDGFFDEFGEIPNNLNLCAFMAVRKSHLVWTIDLNQPDPDSYIQRHLYLGAYPSAPYPLDNHDMLPCGPGVDQLYVDYGPLFEALSGRKWVLEPHAIEVEGDSAKTNFFEVPGGYVALVVMAGNKTEARITLRGLRQLPGQKGFVIAAIQPGAKEWQPLHAREQGKEVVLDVPLARGCGMVKLSYAWIRPEKRYFLKTQTVSLGTTIQGAQFHYTLNGGKPTVDSPAYHEPFTINKTTMLQAALFRAGKQAGEFLIAELVKTPPPAPWIEPFQGKFQEKVTAQLRQPYDIPGAEIRYTLNGPEVPNLSYSLLALPSIQDCAKQQGPEVTQAATLYTGLLEISDATSIYARTFLPDLDPSPRASVHFAKLPPAPPLPKIFISDLTLLSSRSSNNQKPAINRSAAGTPLSINGKTYERGLGVNSPAEIVYKLEPEHTRFVAQVGLDDNVRGRHDSRTAFQVYIRNEREEMLLYSTPVLYPRELWSIDVRIPLFRGRREIRLACNTSTNWDLSDWVNAGFV